MLNQVIVLSTVTNSRLWVRPTTEDVEFCVRFGGLVASELLSVGEVDLGTKAIEGFHGLCERALAGSFSAVLKLQK